METVILLNLLGIQFLFDYSQNEKAQNSIWLIKRDGF
jgi:hypothetical protein